MDNKLKFRLVFKRKINMYQLQYTDQYGNWYIQAIDHTLTKKGEPKDNTSNQGFGLITERVLWDMDYLRYLGYEFIGIEEEKEEEYKWKN